MRYVRRELEGQVRKAARGFPATVLTGPRRAGKTWLLRHLYLLPRASYFLLEDPDVVARLRADPQGKMVDRGRIELPTPGFSVPCSTN
jgi:predicted AAA+ superfamily ATPase